ncbi:CidA/LrgA family protein [Bradyrhizobium cenepequi]
MIVAFLLLIAFELVGELARSALNLPIPGPVIGMFLLAAVLTARRDRPDAPAIPESLGRIAEGLISHMGLLFVPAGVGIIAEAGLLRAEWLPILAGLIGSTILSLAVTGLVMHWTTRPRGDAGCVALEAAPTDLAGHHGGAR